MINHIKKFLQKIFFQRDPLQLICFLLIGLGIILRLKHYLTNCPLWTDEAWVAVSITSRSFMEIFKGVEIFADLPRPPLGFLLLTKWVTGILGSDEYALRLFSLIFGIGSLLLFYRLVRQLKDQFLTIISLGFFSFSPQLIYYSAELKQYSLDLFIGLAVYLIFSIAITTQLDLKKSVFLGVLSCFLMWISNAILFVLAAAGITLTIFSLQERRWKQFGYSFIIYTFWIISFLALYKISFSNMATNAALFRSWPGAVLDAPIFSKEACLWMRDVFLNMFSDPLGFSFVGLAFALFVLGVITLVCRKNVYAFLFIFSILIALLAAILHQYPFRGRLLLFLFPGALIFVVQGILVISRKGIKNLALVVTLIFCCLLFADPFFKTIQGFEKDYCRQDNREAMSFLKDYYQKGDFLLINSAAQFPLWYYGGRLQIAKSFEETWAGFEKDTLKKGVKIAKFWEGIKNVQGVKYIFFRYEYNLYDSNYQYVKSLARIEMSEADLYFLVQGVPFNYPIEGRRLWLVLGDPSPEFEAIARESLGLRFTEVLQFKRKGVSIYLYQVN